MNYENLIAAYRELREFVSKFPAELSFKADLDAADRESAYLQRADTQETYTLIYPNRKQIKHLTLEEAAAKLQIEEKQVKQRATSGKIFNGVEVVSEKMPIKRCKDVTRYNIRNEFTGQTVLKDASIIDIAKFFSTSTSYAYVIARNGKKNGFMFEKVDK